MGMKRLLHLSYKLIPIYNNFKMLPQDPFILFSFINMKLRDECISLDEFCAEFGVSRLEIEEKLAAIGFSYDEENKRFS